VGVNGTKMLFYIKVKTIFENHRICCFWSKDTGTHLFDKVPWPNDQETAKWPLRSSSQAATCYYQSNHSKVDAIPLSAMPKEGHNKRTFRPVSTLTLLNAEHPAGKLWISTFKVFWSDSAKEWNRMIYRLRGERSNT